MLGVDFYVRFHHDVTRYPEIRTVILISSLGVVFSLTQWYDFKQNVSVQKFMVYNVAGHSAIDFIDHGKAYFIADTALQNNMDKISFHLIPHRIKAGDAEQFWGRWVSATASGLHIDGLEGKSFLQIYVQNLQYRMA